MQAILFMEIQLMVQHLVGTISTFQMEPAVMQVVVFHKAMIMALMVRVRQHTLILQEITVEIVLKCLNTKSISLYINDIIHF